MALIGASTQTPFTGYKATYSETNSFEITLLLQNKGTTANIQFNKAYGHVKVKTKMETNAICTYIHTHTLGTMATVKPVNGNLI